MTNNKIKELKLQEEPKGLKMKILARQSWRRYKRLVKRHRKGLVAEAKQAFPYDFDFGLDYFVKFLEYMSEYYRADDNVYSSDSLEKLLEIDQALINYYNYKTVSSKLLEKFEQKNPGIEPPTKLFREIANLEDMYWRKFWNTIKINSRGWWD